MVISCAGGCPIGRLCDEVARLLQERGKAEMIGLSQVLSQPISASHLATADEILLLEGCHAACIRESLNQIGYNPDEYLAVDFSKLGFDFAEVPTKVQIERGYRKALEALE